MKHSYEINKILVPIDFSDASIEALDHASVIAKKVGAGIHLLHVMHVSAHIFPNFEEDLDVNRLKDKLREEIGKIGSACADKHNLNVDTELSEGTIARTIVERSRAIKANLIVMGTHGSSGFEEFFIGSNASKVVTAATCPVLTIRKGTKVSSYAKIALPVDSSNHTRDKVSEAAKIAELFNSTIHMVALITENHEDEKAIFNLKLKQIQEYLDNKGIQHESKELHGEDVAEMTNNFAQMIGADLIVIMTEQEASTGLFVGPHAQRIVNHSRIPVLSVTPIESLDLTSQGNMRPFHS